MRREQQINKSVLYEATEISKRVAILGNKPITIASSKMHTQKGLQEHTAVIVIVFLDWLWLTCTSFPAKALSLL